MSRWVPSGDAPDGRPKKSLVDIMREEQCGSSSHLSVSSGAAEHGPPKTKTMPDNLTEDEALQMALAISASMADNNSQTNPTASTEDLPPPPAAPAPASSPAPFPHVDDKLDESLALAMALQSEEQESYEEFKRNTKTVNAGNSKVKIAYTHTPTAQGGSQNPPERFGADDAARYNILYGVKDAAEEDREGEVTADVGFKMNGGSSAPSAYQRLGDTGFVQNVETNEVVTKHNTSLNMTRNALEINSTSGKVGDKVYNSLRAKMKTTQKGVAKSGTGRAETVYGDKTVDGALDAHVLQVIRKAIDNGVIDECHGCVKEGKEVRLCDEELHWASGGIRKHKKASRNSLSPGEGARKRYNSRASLLRSSSHLPPLTLLFMLQAQIFYAHRDPSSPPCLPPAPSYTPPEVAVKVMKRIQEFSKRGSYVDGDVRYHRKSFKDYDKRDQIALWTEKEYRNLQRSFLAGVSVPRPIAFKANVLMMNFLGSDGFPSPNLKDLSNMDGFSSAKKVVQYYCETIVGVKRLYVCAQLVHGDLSEYNIMLVPSSQIRGQVSSEADEDLDDAARAMPVRTNRIVLIDFAQAVQKSHPEGDALLRRDLNRVNVFFSKYINTLTDDEAMDLVKGPVGAAEKELEGWVDLATGDGDDDGDGDGDGEGGEVDVDADLDADVDDGSRSEAEASFVSVSDNGLSDTTSVKKDKWRHRRHDLNDLEVFRDVFDSVTQKNLALKGKKT